MVPISEIDLNILYDIKDQTRLIRTNKKVSYYNIASSFDIETTSVIYQGEKVAFMYIFMVQIEDYCLYGRTWEEFKTLINFIQEVFQTDSKTILPIYVHNLSYEFQFMMYELTWEKIFSVDERKPIKALTTKGIEFRDSYILSGMSLEKTAENLTSHKIEKLVGNLDYSLIRTKDTILTKKELDYCEFDVRIVVYYIREQIVEYSDITKIPMTNTGRVRKYVRDKCYFTSKNHKKSSRGKYNRYRQLMNDLQLDSITYRKLKQTFQGGFTHANHIYTGETLSNVSSIDFTSSYPSVMLAEKYPMSEPIKLPFQSIEEIENERHKFNYMFRLTLTRVLPTMSENYISESKCLRLEKPVINNGRVSSCDLLVIYVTEIDFDIIRQCYEWESMKVEDVTGFYKNYLPKPIIESILELYQDKTTLKGVAGKEVEYLKSKGMLNSIYGMSVTDIVQPETIFDGETWSQSEVDYDEQIEKYNTNKKRFLYYAWGIYVTAYARRNLWLGITNFGDDYIYSDTDSIKCLNYENHTDFINKYNEIITSKIETVLNYYKLDVSLMKPKTIKGVEKPIGVWDYEGTYDYFKTLGAKRYLTCEDGELHLTVAGLSKKNGLEYMLEQCKGNINKVFEMFNDELYIPSNRTGKNTHTYIDKTYHILIEDFQGHKSEVLTKSGVHLSNADFTLSISKQYGEFLTMFMQGYHYKGVTTRL